MKESEFERKTTTHHWFSYFQIAHKYTYVL